MRKFSFKHLADLQPDDQMSDEAIQAGWARAMRPFMPAPGAEQLGPIQRAWARAMKPFMRKAAS